MPENKRITLDHCVLFISNSWYCPVVPYLASRAVCLVLTLIADSFDRETNIDVICLHFADGRAGAGQDLRNAVAMRLIGSDDTLKVHVYNCVPLCTVVYTNQLPQGRLMSASLTRSEI